MHTGPCALKGPVLNSLGGKEATQAKESKMRKAFKGRTINYRKPCKIYRNLNGDKSQVWSIQQGGLVVAHTDVLRVRNPEFKVNQAGAERVRLEGRKNVHAYVVGFIGGEDKPVRGNPVRVGYNPYTTGMEFRIAKIGEAVEPHGIIVRAAERAILTGEGRMYAWGASSDSCLHL